MTLQIASLWLVQVSYSRTVVLRGFWASRSTMAWTHTSPNLLEWLTHMAAVQRRWLSMEANWQRIGLTGRDSRGVWGLSHQRSQQNCWFRVLSAHVSQGYNHLWHCVASRASRTGVFSNIGHSQLGFEESKPSAFSTGWRVGCWTFR